MYTKNFPSLFSLTILLVFYSVFLEAGNSDIIVSKDGKGDFTSIQDAVNSIPFNNIEMKTIFIKNGIYNEKVFISKSNLTFLGENRDNTQIIFAELRSVWRKLNGDSDWGAGVVNIDDKACNITFRNITIYNNYGSLYGSNDHQFAVRGGNADKISFIRCNIKSDGGDTFAIWNKKSGKYYVNECYIDGWVDFICPRGWCYITNSRFYQKSSKASASIWHDGSEDIESRLVIKSSYFDGVKGFKLGRYHRDAQFFLIDCTFSDNMKDLPIYFNKSEPPVEIKWGERCYYYNCNKENGNFSWHENNLNEAPGSPDPIVIDAKWTFSTAPELWDPENDTIFIEESSFRAKTIEIPDTVKFIADNFLTLHPDTVAYKTEAKSYKWNYEQGLVFEALYRTWLHTQNVKYFNYIKKNIDYYISPDGIIKTYKSEEFNLDNIASGRQLLHIYERCPELKYLTAIESLLDQLKSQPRNTEGGFWHKKIYPYQMWLDGLYMAQPFYSYYADLFNKEKIFDDVLNQFRLIKKHLRDSRSGLYYHGWDESKKQKWADPVKGTSPNFWGRSIGWFMMALVDVLDYFPEEHEGYNELLSMFRDLSGSIIKFRDDKTKLWHQIIDKGDSTGNYIEASGSLMFIYSLARGVNNNLLNKSFLQVADESFKSVFRNLITFDELGNLLLNNVCSVGGLGGKPYRDGSLKYYVSEPIRINDFKGYGPLLLAAIEIAKSQGKVY